MGDVRVESSASNVHDGSVVETELLIVGAGPAGAALACFLSYHGKLPSVHVSRSNSLQA